MENSLNALRISLIVFGVLVLGFTLVAFMVFGDKDAPGVFLEDDPAIQAREDYPVRILDVGDLESDMLIERDVWLDMRDGVRLSANVFRPRTPGEYPVVMAFTAYDKNNGPDLYPKLLRNGLKSNFDLGRIAVSPWTSWEGPDPAFWVRHGYAVVYVDSRGYAGSEGDPTTLSMQDRDDFYDAIQWAGTQDWSNGNVGLNGVSYLAISQWVAASGRPPHLKAIIPWEGQTNAFTDVLYHGGIPETVFTAFWLRKVRSGANGNPLPPPAIFEFAHQRPAMLKRIQERPANLSGIDLPQIQVPALICATWSDQGLHSRGSFEGYRQISSTQKWLFTHGRSKWDVYYSDEGLAYQKDFFDHFLKGIDNGFDTRPAVRLEVRDTLTDYTVRYEDDWPIPRTRYTAMYLDAGSSTLSTEPAAMNATARYASLSESAQFTHTFIEDTELSGHMKLKLHVAIEDGDDMDLFVGVEKLDRDGNEVQFFAKTGFIEGPVAMGWLRASHRELDPERSTPWQPVLAYEGQTPLVPGTITPVEIEILPSSTLFRAGETLRLTIQGDDLFEHPSLGHGYPVNRGEHQIHTGGDYDSHLLIPVIPRAAE